MWEITPKEFEYQDPFYVGNLVAYMLEKEPCVVLVTGLPLASIEHFEGVIISQPSEQDKKDGIYRKDWRKSVFMQFSGSIKITN